MFSFSSNMNIFLQAWWYILIILTLERQKQEDHEFKASLGCVEMDENY